ncbi:hypothetical protein [Ruegeria atlantica]|uniref:hypothetical protein n=1 Tax=Ruegeria atlantica TaxID=81569 RepID=UPI0024949669|nr:hypothetical protein [Ruegeria atlantica]
MAADATNTKTAKPKARKSCKHCKSRYTPFRKTSQYCSDSCRVLAHNKRKAEAAAASVKHEERMQRSLRWHRNQEHLRHLSDDDLRVLIEAKWQDRLERDHNRRVLAKERYAYRKASEQNVITCPEVNDDGKDTQQKVEECRPASKTNEATVTTTPIKVEIGPSKKRPYPKIETKRKRVFVANNPTNLTGQK